VTDAVRHDSADSAIPEYRRVPPVVWLALFGVLAVWVAHRAGAFDLWTTVRTADGSAVRLPNVYGTVDHPFHATRADLLRRAILDGHPLRWVGSHQGGYPVEFYPLGVAGLEVGLWALLVGSVPMLVVHKLVVTLIFLAPGLAYGLAARRDRLPLGVGLVALAAHVVVRGWWWSGGYQELVEWGLITNVAAAVSALFVLVFLTSYLDRGRGWDGALAALFGGFCLYSNPRSAIALAIVGVGAGVAVGFGRWADRRIPRTRRGGPPCPPSSRTRSGVEEEGGHEGPPPQVLGEFTQIVKRLVMVALATALIAAPEIVSLLRFEHLYYFVQYQKYADLSAYWHSSIQAVSGPVFVVGLAGLATALVLPWRPITRAIGITFALYCLVTAFLSEGAGPGSLVEQLETTRLMPFQRLLMLFLAAVAVHDLAWWLAGLVPRARGLATDAVLIVVSVAMPVLYVLSPPAWIPVGDRGLVEVPTAAVPGIADLREAVRVADEAAAPGTALLVLGSTLSWHSNLWAPLWSDRPFFYDDWLWYWQTRHVGPYDPLTEHAYDPAAMDDVLSPDYLDEHGIGAVIVTRTARTDLAASAAESASNLERIRSGNYDVYLVRDPTTVVTVGSTNAESESVTDQQIDAVGTSTGGVAKIRRNWFPRWRAWVNGRSVPVTETADGYMTVSVPSGRVEIELKYVVDRWDWVARAMCVAGLAMVVVLAVPRLRTARPRVRSGRR
jgi:hypothetical protein